MTIILQHQFWDLVVGENGFEVGLSFSNVPERVVVPFDALTGFFDPSVQFGLKFEVQDTIEEGANDTEPPPAHAAGKIAGPRVAEKAKGADHADAKPVGKSSPKGKSPDKTPAGKPEEKTEAAEGDAKIVSIDAFRKKT